MDHRPDQAILKVETPLDEARGLLYAMTRFDDAVKVIDLRSNVEVVRLTGDNGSAVSRLLNIDGFLSMLVYSL